MDISDDQHVTRICWYCEGTGIIGYAKRVGYKIIADLNGGQAVRCSRCHGTGRIAPEVSDQQYFYSSRDN